MICRLRIIFLTLASLFIFQLAFALPLNSNSDMLELRGRHINRQLIALEFSANYPSLPSTDIDKLLRMTEYFSHLDPTEEINEAVVQALGRFLRFEESNSGAPRYHEVIVRMLELLIQNGDGAIFTDFRTQVLPFRDLEVFRAPYGELISKAEAVISSRILRLDRVAYMERGLERWEVEKMASYARAVLNEIDQKNPNNVISIKTRCEIHLDSQKGKN